MRQNYKLPFFHPNHRQRNIILQLSIHYHGPMRSLSYSFFLSTTDLTDRTDECPGSAGCKTKTKINPLVRMEGVALAVMLPLWSYKSELLTPKPEAYHHLHS